MLNLNYHISYLESLKNLPNDWINQENSISPNEHSINITINILKLFFKNIDENLGNKILLSPLAIGGISIELNKNLTILVYNDGNYTIEYLDGKGNYLEKHNFLK